MKIAFLRRNWSATGGAENYLQRLSSALREKGHQLSLVCEKWNQAGGGFDEIHSLPVSGPSFLRPRRFADAANAFLSGKAFDRVFSMERGIKADIYRAGDGVHREWLRLRARHRPVSGLLDNWINPKNHVVLGLERATFHPGNTGRVIANSHLVKANILSHFDFPEDRISIVTNGVDSGLFSSGNRTEGRAALGAQPGEKILLLIGNGPERKGHRAAREVARRIGKRARLVIIDSPPSRPIQDIYAAADLFLAPTLYDPFANVTLEAMAAGLPVITTAANGASEIIHSGKNGFVVPSASEVQEMTAYALACLEDSVARRIGEAGRETARDQSLGKNVRETLAVIESP